MPHRPDTRITLSGLLHTTSGRIVIVGSLLQLPPAAFLAFKACRAFPADASEELLGLAFLHLAAVVGLLGGWLEYGEHLRFRNNRLQNLFLLLVTVAPMVISYARLA